MFIFFNFSIEMISGCDGNRDTVCIGKLLSFRFDFDQSICPFLLYTHCLIWILHHHYYCMIEKYHSHSHDYYYYYYYNNDENSIHSHFIIWLFIVLIDHLSFDENIMINFFSHEFFSSLFVCVCVCVLLLGSVHFQPKKKHLSFKKNLPYLKMNFFKFISITTGFCCSLVYLNYLY